MFKRGKDSWGIPFIWPLMVSSLLVALLGVAGVASAQPLEIEDLPFSIEPKRFPTAKSAAAMPEPDGPNPHLSFIPGERRVDWDYWEKRARLEGRERRAAMLAAGLGTALVSFSESEPNDSPSAANPIPELGTAPDEESAIDVEGSFSLPVPPPLAILPEDDGSIPLATPVNLVSGSAVRVSGVVGDGPFGSSGGGTTGDVDFFRISGVSAGQAILVDVDTAATSGLDPFVILWSAGGSILAFNDNDPASTDSLLVATAPADGDYYVSITGFGTFLTLDPFDSSSGAGLGSEGTYEATLGIDFIDSDFFSVELRSGDVFSANLLGTAAAVLLFDPSGTLRVGSRGDRSFLYPVGLSPLPGGGNASSAYVVEEPGTWTVRVDGSVSGPYTAELRLFRPGLETAAPAALQRIFLDFDGATVDANAILGIGSSNAVLSPLASFLPRWGLSAADEDAVIDAIVAAVVENLSEDMRVKGFNGDFANSGIPGEFDVEILNSRDHADTFGLDPTVSRVIVGGTTAELGIGTVGIAQSIDPGNFDTGETGFMLLDFLSNPAPFPISLNSVPLAPGVSIIDLIGIGVGNITAHEAGHYLGSFHTDQIQGPANIMDQGGDLGAILGVGPDGIFGTADDEDVDFITDVYAPSEGDFGLEDTLNTTAFAASTPVGSTVVIAGCDSGVADLFLADDTTIKENLGICVVLSRDEDDFEDCAEDLLESLEDDGLLNDDQAERIEDCVEEASIPSLAGGDDDDDDGGDDDDDDDGGDDDD